MYPKNSDIFQNSFSKLRVSKTHSFMVLGKVLLHRTVGVMMGWNSANCFKNYSWIQGDHIVEKVIGILGFMTSSWKSQSHDQSSLKHPWISMKILEYRGVFVEFWHHWKVLKYHWISLEFHHTNFVVTLLMKLLWVSGMIMVQRNWLAGMAYRFPMYRILANINFCQMWDIIPRGHHSVHVVTV